MLVATDYPFLDIFWTMIIFFAWVIWAALVIIVLLDNFRRHDQSGWAKVGWTLLVIFVPLIGVLVYIVARPGRPEEMVT
jgi:hypothetical protein